MGDSAEDKGTETSQTMGQEPAKVDEDQPNQLLTEISKNDASIKLLDEPLATNSLTETAQNVVSEATKDKNTSEIDGTEETNEIEKGDVNKAEEIIDGANKTTETVLSNIDENIAESGSKSDQVICETENTTSQETSGKMLDNTIETNGTTNTSSKTNEDTVNSNSIMADTDDDTSDDEIKIEEYVKPQIEEIILDDDDEETTSIDKSSSEVEIMETQMIPATENNTVLAGPTTELEAEATENQPALAAPTIELEAEATENQPALAAPITEMEVQSVTPDTNNKEIDPAAATSVSTIEQDGEKARKRVKRTNENVNKQIQCINQHCDSGVDLFEAPISALSYYGLFKRDVIQKICQKCFSKVVEHYEVLSGLLVNKLPLASIEIPATKDDVVDMDRVEEIRDEPEPILPKDVIKLVEDQLLSCIGEKFDEYDINFQMQEMEKVVDKELNRLTETNNEISNMVLDLERKLTKRHRLMYKDFNPRIQVASTLEMDEDGNIVRSQSNNLFTTPKRYSNNYKLRPSPVAIQPKPSTSSTSQIAFESETQVTLMQTKDLVEPESTPSNLEIVALKSVAFNTPNLPPIGKLDRPPLKPGDLCYVVKTNLFSNWAKAKVLEIVDGMYKVRFVNIAPQSQKCVTGKQLAYIDPSPVRYTVGDRVIALFRDIERQSKEAYYVGIIAEPPKVTNNNRYLVFFDDGYSQYVTHDKINLVVETSFYVWDDINAESREFIQTYLTQYPERPMVRLQPGQIVKTQYANKWLAAKVVAVDCSLVQLYFQERKRMELIYRGSTRLEPLYKALTAAAARKEGHSRHRTLGISSLKKKNLPYVQYTQEQDDGRSSSPLLFTIPSSKNVAKKSTTKPSENQEVPRPPLPHEKIEHLSKGIIRSINLNTNIQSRVFEPHQCVNDCIAWTRYEESDCAGTSPLAIPLFFGFRRIIGKHKSRKYVIYIAPCGRVLRSMDEIHRYLRITKSTMSVDLFDVDHWVNATNEFHIEQKDYKTFIPDISYGVEATPISCVNELNHSWPMFMEYANKRMPQDGVSLCLEEDFLVCCDCTDNCQNKAKCACWQLTIEGTKQGSNKEGDPSVGYMYRRLPEALITGIYECNARCKCSKTCLNRVVQFPLSVNLQIFRTKKKGWGIRTLNDIPHGGFICTYVGRLHTEQSANEDGRKYGDEYLAELDYIEVVERYKEGYEENACQDDDSDYDNKKDGEDDDEDDDDDEEENSHEKFENYTPTSHRKIESMESNIRTRAKNKEEKSSDEEGKGCENNVQSGRDVDVNSEEGKKESSEDNKTNGKKELNGEGSNDDDDENGAEHEPSRFAAVDDEESRTKYKSIREMYGDGLDDIYVMDAKSSGNIGRYLNHSCQPNIFVQNVFVDTHDLRFPWICFFASTHIKAGTELTWDYNYDVGSVPNKILYCYCNSSECRGRLI